MKKIIYTTFLLLSSISTLMASEAPYEVEEIKIYKSLHILDLIVDGKIYKTFPIMIGRGGLGPKKQEGDLLTPEGKYFVDNKNPESKFYKALHVSYPNEIDQARAKEAGVSAGFDIMIHGLPNHPSIWMSASIYTGAIQYIDWTAGCIAVLNKDMEEIYEHTSINTPIKIVH